MPTRWLFCDGCGLMFRVGPPVDGDAVVICKEPTCGWTVWARTPKGGDRLVLGIEPVPSDPKTSH